MSNALLIKSYTALAAVAGHVIVAAGEDGVTTAAASTGKLIGVADSMGADSGGRLDVHLIGLSEVRAGGTFDFGDPLTSNASGHAIKAVATAGSTIRVIGIAQSDAVSGDIVPVLLAPSAIALPA